jgi:LysM repeat protein
VGVATLKRTNGMKKSTVRAGQVLKIPRYSTVAYTSDYTQKSLPKKSGSVNGATKTTTRYRVAKGDTMQKISNQFGVQVASLMKANNKSSPRNLKVGEVLLIPQNRAIVASSNGNKKSQNSDIKNVINYRVKNGDTLWKIASRYDVSVTQIKKWNNLRSTKLATGDKLRIFVD